MQTSRSKAWLTVTQLLAFALAMIAFVYWAPWTASITTDEAVRRYPGQVDPSWRAVHVNHGKAEEWRLGTPHQNPAGFGICTAALFGGLAYAFGVALFRQIRSDGDQPGR